MAPPSAARSILSPKAAAAAVRARAVVASLRIIACGQCTDAVSNRLLVTQLASGGSVVGSSQQSTLEGSGRACASRIARAVTHQLRAIMVASLRKQE